MEYLITIIAIPKDLMNFIDIMLSKKKNVRPKKKKKGKYAV